MTELMQLYKFRRFAGNKLEVRAALEFKLEDLWIGAFWRQDGNCIDLWICLLPCLPLHVSWWWSGGSDR